MNVMMEYYKDIIVKLFKELDDYFFSVKSYSDDFKKKVGDLMVSRAYGDSQLSEGAALNYTKEAVTQRFFELKDAQLISEYLKHARDNVFN